MPILNIPDDRAAAMRAALTDRIAHLEALVRCCHAEDESELRTEKEQCEATLRELDDPQPVKALILLEGGLVSDVYATCPVDVDVWDMDVEDDDRNHDPAEVESYVAEHGMSGVYWRS